MYCSTFTGFSVEKVDSLIDRILTESIYNN